MVIKIWPMIFTAGLLCGCGNVRFLTSQCMLSDNSMVSIESKTYSNNRSEIAISPSDVLPNTFAFVNIADDTTIDIKSHGLNVANLKLAGLEGWHVGDTGISAKSHFILAGPLSVRIDSVSPGRLTIGVAGRKSDPMESGCPKSAISTIHNDRYEIVVNGFMIDGNWTQAEVILNNKMIKSVTTNEGHFSIPDEAGFEMRMPRQR